MKELINDCLCLQSVIFATVHKCQEAVRYAGKCAENSGKVYGSFLVIFLWVFLFICAYVSSPTTVPQPGGPDLIYR
jgi:hypothetical protein